MSMRAVILGSETGGLAGVHNDTREIGQRLSERQFALDTRIGPDASRAGILDAMERLIRDSQPSDAALVYYSGHGGVFTRPAARAGEASVVQCIVPSDWDEPGEFRGVLDVELSALLQRLTEKTENVTVILDCCHSSRMMRAQEEPFCQARVIARAWDERLTEFLARREFDVRPLQVEANPYAVRLAAAEQDQFAYERLQQLAGRTVRMGNLTYALSQTLDELGTTQVSWRALLGRVREQVMACQPSQRPELSGPRDRIVFRTELAPTLADLDAVGFFFDAQDQPALRAGQLLGAAPGITYDVLPRAAPRFAPEFVVARARVTRVVGNVAHVALSDQKGEGPKAGDFAIPTAAPYPKASLRLTGEGEAGEALLSLVQASRYLRAATEGEVPQLTFSVSENRIEVLAGDERLIDPVRNDAAGRSSALKAAERWSRGLAVAKLPSGGLPASAFEVSWGRVEKGARIPMAQGDALHVGDSIYVDVVNKDPKKLWVGILDIGVTGNVCLLTDSTPQGRILQQMGNLPLDRFTLGDNRGTLAGLGPVSWPDDAPQSAASRLERLVVIAAEDEADFATFETPPGLRASNGRSGLSTVFDALCDGSTRDFDKTKTPAAYACHVIEFELQRATRASMRDDRDAGKGVMASVGRRETQTIPRLELSDLSPADVLLSLGGSSVSQGILGLDGGWYSHAALWTGTDVIESTDPTVQRHSLAASVRAGNRRYVDVYRNPRLTPAQREAIVERATSYVGRKYAFGDLLLGAAIVSSGSFLFRTSDPSQRAWLHAMNLLNSVLTLQLERKDELLTCAELVARSYGHAGAPLTIDISGLRAFKGRELREALRNLAAHHLPFARGSEPDVLLQIQAFQAQLAQFYGAEAEALLPIDDAAGARAFTSVVKAGVNWGANLVTPRDLMQSPDLELVGSVAV